MEWNIIGVVTKPQALKGEFRLKPSLLNMKKYKKLTLVQIDGKEYNIERVSLRDAFVILKLQGIDTCESAENLRNKDVFACVEVDTDEHFDLVGFDVKVEGKSIGKVVSIDNYGSKDILSIKGDRNVMLPVIDGLVLDVDGDQKIVTLDSKIMDEVAVYED